MPLPIDPSSLLAAGVGTIAVAAAAGFVVYEQKNAPVDCQVSDWSNWSDCSAKCGGGTQTRTRTIVTQPLNDGQVCPTLSDSQACNTNVCPPPSGIQCSAKPPPEFSCTDPMKKPSCDSTTGTWICFDNPDVCKASDTPDCMHTNPDVCKKADDCLPVCNASSGGQWTCLPKCAGQLPPTNCSAGMAPQCVLTGGTTNVYSYQCVDICSGGADSCAADEVRMCDTSSKQYVCKSVCDGTTQPDCATYQTATEPKFVPFCNAATQKYDCKSACEESTKPSPSDSQYIYCDTSSNQYKLKSYCDGMPDPSATDCDSTYNNVVCQLGSDGKTWAKGCVSKCGPKPDCPSLTDRTCDPTTGMWSGQCESICGPNSCDTTTQSSVCDAGTRQWKCTNVSCAATPPSSFQCPPADADPQLRYVASCSPQTGYQYQCLPACLSAPPQGFTCAPETSQAYCSADSNFKWACAPRSTAVDVCGLTSKPSCSGAFCTPGINGWVWKCPGEMNANDFTQYYGWIAPTFPVAGSTTNATQTIVMKDNDQAIYPSQGPVCTDLSKPADYYAPNSTSVINAINNPPGNVIVDPATNRLSWMPFDVAKTAYYRPMGASNPNRYCPLDRRGMCAQHGTFNQTKPFLLNDPTTGTLDGSCSCDSGYAGPKCQYSNAANCNNHGTVQNDGSCVCSGGWVGAQCQYSSATTCNNHGTVSTNGSCTCSNGWRTLPGSNNTCNDCQFGAIPACDAPCGSTMYETVIAANAGDAVCNQNRLSQTCNTQSCTTNINKTNVIIVGNNRAGCVQFVNGSPTPAPLTTNPPQYNVSAGTIVGTNFVLKLRNGTTNQCYLTQPGTTYPQDNRSAAWMDTYWALNLSNNSYQRLQNDADFSNPMLSSLFYVVDMSKISQYANANTATFMTTALQLDPFAVIAPGSTRTFSAWFAVNNGMVVQVNPPSGYVKLSDFIGSTSVAIPPVFLFAKYDAANPLNSWWVKECDGLKILFDSNTGNCPIFGAPYPHFRIAQPTCSDGNYVAIGMYLGYGSNITTGCGGADCGSYAGFKAVQGGVGIYAIHRSLLIAVASNVTLANATYRTGGGCAPARLNALMTSAYNTFFPFTVDTWWQVHIPTIPFYQLIPFLASSQSLAGVSLATVSHVPQSPSLSPEDKRKQLMQQLIAQAHRGKAGVGDVQQCVIM